MQLYVVFELLSFTLKKINPITEYFDRKRHFTTDAYDRLMTEAQTQIFGLIIYILRTKLEELHTVFRVR